MLQAALDLLQTPLTILVATANEERRPQFLRAFGIAIDDVQRRATAYAPEVMARSTIANLERHPAVAVTLASMEDFRGVQLKGDVVAHGPAGPEADALIDDNQRRVIELLRGHVGAHMAEGWQRFITRPAIAITFDIRDVFDQTPGRRAGARLG